MMQGKRVQVIDTNNFKGKTLLITGGTGSFGNAVLKFFLENTEIHEIRVFSRDEKKQDEMRRTYRSEKINYYIGNVRDTASIDNALESVDYIFHAAALKQVPSCEYFPMEAVKTNIIGTDNVLNAAVRAGVKKIVCLSTDKAAYPVNSMGISKAMMEKVFISKARVVPEEKTLICGTRYGNVLASRGSVVPLFISQIKSGHPISVTNPNMTRFLIGLDEAVNLVLFAFCNANTGDIFVQKAPSAFIGDLALALREIFKADNDIVTIGTRHGEKIHEVLLTKEEASRAQDMGDYYRIPADNRTLNYEKYLELGSKAISHTEEYRSDNTTILGVDEIVEKLLSMDYVKSELKGWKKI